MLKEDFRHHHKGDIEKVSQEDKDIGRKKPLDEPHLPGAKESDYI